MSLEPTIQSEVSQKERHKYHILTLIYGFYSTSAMYWVLTLPISTITWLQQFLFALNLVFIFIGSISLVISKKRISVVQSLSHMWLFATPWTAIHQASLSSTISWSLLKFMSIELVMLSNHLILCHCLLLLSSVFLSFRVFSNESSLCIRQPKY